MSRGVNRSLLAAIDHGSTNGLIRLDVHELLSSEVGEVCTFHYSRIRYLFTLPADSVTNVRSFLIISYDIGNLQS